MIPGFTLQAESLDDAVNGVHNPPQGQKNVQALASDPAVLGIVGPFNSNVAQAEIPTSNALGIALVAPSTTNPTLTKGPEALELRRQNPDQITFFRVCATDDVQGPVGADYAAKTLHLKRAYVVDDNETYGKGIADQWAARFIADGGTVVSHQHLTPGQTDFHALLTDAAAANPDVIFYGGTSATGGDQLRKQMAGTPLANVTMFGGDGIRNDEFLKIAGSMANNVYATVASVNAAKLPAAQSFLKEYQATYHVPVGSYSASGYVAAMVIINAAAEAVKANGGKMPSRADVLARLDPQGAEVRHDHRLVQLRQVRRPDEQDHLDLRGEGRCLGLLDADQVRNVGPGRQRVVRPPHACPAADQRRRDGRHVRPHSAGLHDGVRHHRAHQLRAR
jgi:branched-chain amino acid transport system substrate-binding protein